MHVTEHGAGSGGRELGVDRCFVPVGRDGGADPVAGQAELNGHVPDSDGQQVGQLYMEADEGNNGCGSRAGLFRTVVVRWRLGRVELSTQEHAFGRHYSTAAQYQDRLILRDRLIASARIVYLATRALQCAGTVAADVRDSRQHGVW